MKIRYDWRPIPVLNTTVKQAWVIIGILSASRRSTAGKGHTDHLESTLCLRWYSATARTSTTVTTPIKSGKHFVDATGKRQLVIALSGQGTGQTTGENRNVTTRKEKNN